MKQSATREKSAKNALSSRRIRHGFSVEARPVLKNLNVFDKMEMPIAGTNAVKKMGHRAAAQLREPPASLSSCSSSVMVLEETIADVMGVRMQSLNDLSARVEELSTLHRQEEEAFRQQMNAVLQQLETTRAKQLDTEQDYEALLKKERVERQLIMSMMQRFKTEGSKVIETMKKSLDEAKLKWKAEVERNANLTAQLRRCYNNNNNNNNTLKGGIKMNDTDKSALEPGVNELSDKVKILTRLLEEEDGIIVELQQRNKALEKKVSILTQQRDSFLNLEAQHVGSEEFNKEYVNLLDTVRDIGDDKNEVSLEKKVEAFACFTKMLLQRLQDEQRQRLRVEEQTVLMASEHEQAVRVLEARIRNSESQKNLCTPFRCQGVSFADTDKISDTVLDAVARTNLLPRSNAFSSPCENNTATKDATEAKKVDKDDVCHTCCGSFEINNVEAEHEKQMINDSTKYVEHAALEAQFTAVARNFQQSVEEWDTLSLGSEKAF